MNIYYILIFLIIILFIIFINYYYFDNEYNCIILSNNGKINNHEYSYTVLFDNLNKYEKINIISYNKNLKIGSKQKIKINKQGIYYID